MAEAAEAAAAPPVQAHAPIAQVQAAQVQAAQAVPHPAHLHAVHVRLPVKKAAAAVLRHVTAAVPKTAFLPHPGPAAASTGAAINNAATVALSRVRNHAQTAARPCANPDAKIAAKIQTANT